MSTTSMYDERRRYFRINDAIGIAYRALSQAEVSVLADNIRQHKPGVDFVSHFDNRIRTLIDSCRVQSPLTAELIDLVDKKLSFVISQLNLDGDFAQKLAYTLREANVSACGVAFASDEPLALGEVLQLDLVLHPSELHLTTLAKVVACDRDRVESTEIYFARLDFCEISHTDQEVLIQHIVKRQSEQLMVRRQRADDAMDSARDQS